MQSRIPVAYASKAQGSASEEASYSLLTLTPALRELIDSGRSLEVRGTGSDAAVLVSSSQTFALRGVHSSNSILVASSRTAEDDPKGKRRAIEVETALNETLEAVPVVARTERIKTLVRGSEYYGEDIEVESQSNPSKRVCTFAVLQDNLPASDSEIRAALRKLRVIAVPDKDSPTGYDPDDVPLRLVPPATMVKILSATLETLELLAAKKDGTVTASLDDVIGAIDAQDCSKVVGTQVLDWFRIRDKVADGQIKMRLVDLVRELGINVLAQGGHRARPLQPFMKEWQDAAHDFASSCTMDLLASSTLSAPGPPPTVTYFPISHLSPDPSTRFGELFGAQPRWEESKILPFVDDLAPDKKKRDALVLKFVRKVREGSRVFWAPRNLF